MAHKVILFLLIFGTLASYYTCVQHVSFDLVVLFYNNDSSMALHECKEYFGTKNDTQSTLALIDDIFFDTLVLLQNKSIIIKQNPQTQLFNNSKFTNCSLSLNVITLTTDFIINT
eukprot:398188_1